jgi:hypothetical protein
MTFLQQLDVFRAFNSKLNVAIYDLHTVMDVLETDTSVASKHKILMVG